MSASAAGDAAAACTDSHTHTEAHGDMHAEDAVSTASVQ